MNITPDEKDRAIESILAQGLTRPVSTWVFLLNMYHSLGLRVIFWESGPAVLASVVIAAAYIMLGLMPLALIEDRIAITLNIYSSLFLFAPALFIGLTLSTEAMERFGGIYELRMTCKYTIRQIMAFRLLCFSLIGTVFTVVGSALICRITETGYFLQLLSLALCSLFLCSLLIICAMRRWRGGWYIGAAVWTVGGMLPIMIFGRAWDSLLADMPVAVTLGVAAAACVLFLREIKIITRNSEVYKYADS